MQEKMLSDVLQETVLLDSVYLQRKVRVDSYLPDGLPDLNGIPLLLINDGQDMKTMGFASMLENCYEIGSIQPMLFVAIHAGKDRKMEYGTARQLDYMGRGAKAGAYGRFILEELLPYLLRRYNVDSFGEMAMAGFSLGGLMALDFVWEHAPLFKTVGVFSGSLWWRQKGLLEGYVEEEDRIMHKLIREGTYHPGLRFFFSTGSLDETADRNSNGIIDSIDDCLGAIDELQQKGYDADAIYYLNFEDGKHDVPTWGRAMPVFLQWGWGKSRDESGS